MSLKGVKEKKKVDLSSFTSLKVGGKAKYFFLIEDQQGLISLLNKIKEPFYFLGNGSNLLVESREIKKPVLKLSKNFSFISFKNGFWEVGASTLLSFLVQYCINKQKAGIENLAGMPATIGGMLATNGASFGASIFDCLQEAEVVALNGSLLRIKKKEIKYGYRFSGLAEYVIVKGVFKFLESKIKVKEKIKAVLNKRFAAQDFSFPSCGSVFKNPKGAAAAKLIEGSGMKGARKAGMAISRKHANFMLNLGKGSYRDADYLIAKVKDAVFKHKKIILEEEIERWV